MDNSNQGVNKTVRSEDCMNPEALFLSDPNTLSWLPGVLSRIRIEHDSDLQNSEHSMKQAQFTQLNREVENTKAIEDPVDNRLHDVNC